MEYKVTFKNNKAVAARALPSIDNEKLIDLISQGNRKLMNWLVVVGDNEGDAIQMADNILHGFWANYLKIQA